MTWAEFKAAVEEQGVQDSDKIEFIDIGATGKVEVDRTKSGYFYVVDDWS